MYTSLHGFLRRSALAGIAIFVACTAHADDAQTLWSKLASGGNIILLRHAQTEPGSGDPPDFVLGNCKTQRNLSETGRAQAKRIGEALRARAVVVRRVRSSEFCRCLETAQLAFGTVEPWPALNSIFETSVQNDARVAALKRYLSERLATEANEPNEGNNVLVTHNVNISAATGIGPVMGEMVIVAPDGKGGFSVLGRLLPAEP
jgi:phosphohistidine phosphatase SixA